MSIFGKAIREGVQKGVKDSIPSMLDGIVPMVMKETLIMLRDRSPQAVDIEGVVYVVTVTKA